MFRSLVALCVLFPLQLVTADSNWYAVFWNSTLKTQLNDTFRTFIPLNANDNSSFLFQCDHTTIAFQPADITPYTPRFGEKQTARILGYAHDEHGQAILLRYDSANPIPTLNSFPHTTISVQNVGPYSAVYSNDLWSRVNASGAVNITFAGGFPNTIAFADTTNVVNNTLNFTLPAITLGANSYAATSVQVILPPAGGWFELEGIFCVNIGWNGSVCTPPTTAAPTTVAPTTAAPNTTTVAPTTAAPSTAAPTTAAPSTASPTTVTPTTAAPNTTTPAPTTPVPTTRAPFNNTASTVTTTANGLFKVMLSLVLVFLY